VGMYHARRNSCIILVALVMVYSIPEYNHTSEILATRGHFFEKRFGSLVLDSIPVSAHPVRTASTSTPAVLRQRGFAWHPHHAPIAAILAPVAKDCGVGAEVGPLHPEECVRRHLAGTARAEVLATLVSEVLGALLGGHQEVGCRSGVTIFVRRAEDPQNMHYDAVATDTTPCAEVGAHGSGTMLLRAWMPLHSVISAPLLLADTSGLYANACPRRAGLDEENNEASRSPTARIFSVADFERDCATARSRALDPATGTCRWLHTLGMDVGELLFFSNGDVMHGTAAHGEATTPPRVSVAVDCTVAVTPAT